MEGAAPIEPDAAEAPAIEVVGALLERLGYPEAKVARSSAWLPDELSEDKSLVIEVSGGGAEALLAHDMEGLLALQFIARLLLARRADGWVNLLVDVNGDRARRVQELVNLARQSADLVEREGLAVSLPPMAPYERRIVHIALKDHPAIATQSIGAGPRRKVTVRRVDQMLPEL
jgi:spoIIIJ-associated protein